MTYLLSNFSVHVCVVKDSKTVVMAKLRSFSSKSVICASVAVLLVLVVGFTFVSFIVSENRINFDTKDVSTRQAETDNTPKKLFLPPSRLPPTRENMLTVWWNHYDLQYIGNWHFYMYGVLEKLGMPVRLAVTKDDDILQLTPGYHFFPVTWRNARKVVDEIAPRMNLSKYGLLILNDELNEFEMNVLKPQVTFVVRPYYFDRIFADKRHVWMPTGYLEGRGPRPSAMLLPASQRLTGCWFSGSERAERRAMFNAFQADTANPCELTMTSGFLEGLGAREYTFKMQEVVFALCPRGNSPETIRIYEAFEHGAIPVMTEYDFNLGFFNITHYDSPMLIVPNWDAAPKIIRKWLRPKHSEKLDQLQKDNMQWYKLFKQRVSINVCKAIRRGLDLPD